MLGFPVERGISYPEAFTLRMSLSLREYFVCVSTAPPAGFLSIAMIHAYDLYLPPNAVLPSEH